MNENFNTYFSLFVAFFAVLSSLFSTIISNWHEVKIFKLKSKNDNLLRTNDLIIRVYENYLRSAGAVISYPNDVNLTEYGKTYSLVMIHVPIEVFQDIQECNTLISNKKMTEASKKLDEIIYQLREIVEKMYK